MRPYLCPKRKLSVAHTHMHTRMRSYDDDVAAEEAWRPAPRGPEQRDARLQSKGHDGGMYPSTVWPFSIVGPTVL